MYPEELSNCGCPQEPTTPPVAPPAPPICNNGEPCPEVMNTSCVRYDGPDIPGVAATGDNMSEVLQGLSNNGNIGGGVANFTLVPVGGLIQIDGQSTEPVLVNEDNPIVELSVTPIPGPAGPPGQSLTVEGYTTDYTSLIADFGGQLTGPIPTALTTVMLTGAGVNGTIYVYDPTSSVADAEGWVNVGQIVGPPGADGQPGPAGPDGAKILSGSVNPVAGNGADGDYWFNTTTKTLYGPKVGGAWPANGTSLQGNPGANGPAGTAATVQIGTVQTGAAGSQAQVTNAGSTSNAILNFVIPQGANGAAGAAGAAGADGRTILNGTTVPGAGLGQVGDFYLNTATYLLYGPKTSSGWGSGQPLIGAAGQNGATGPAGSNGTDGADGGAKILGFRQVNTASAAADKLIKTTDTSWMIETTHTTGELIIEIPAGLTAFPIGFQVIIMRKGTTGVTGTTKIQPVGGSGVNLVSANDMRYLRALYSAATLVKRSETEWYLYGDISPF